MFDNLFGFAGTTVTAAALFLLILTISFAVSFVSRGNLEAATDGTPGRFSRPRI